jgi:ATP-dependent Clp protease protease subunit
MNVNKDLLQARKIYLSNNIDSAMADSIGEDLLLLNARDESLPIFLYINSGGGLYQSSMDIYDYVLNSHAPVVGIVYSKADSMASIILQACKKRQIMRNSSICLHNLSVWVDTEWDKFEELARERIALTMKRQNLIYEIFTERTGLRKEEIVDICNKKTIFSAEEALKNNLVDEII